MEYEQARRHPKVDDKMAAEVGEMRKAVARMDARDKRARKSERMRFTIEQQDLVYAVWQEAQKNDAVKQMAGSNKRIRYEHAFRYFARRLIAGGIRNGEDFVACIGAYNDRVYRAAKKNLRR